MEFLGFDHIGLYVLPEQVDTAIAFYTGLGGTVTFSFPMQDTGRTIYFVEMAKGATVEIVPNGDGKPESSAKWAHIALATKDVKGAFEKAIALGAKERNAPRSLQLGSRAAENAFAIGPCGEVVEFFAMEESK